MALMHAFRRHVIGGATGNREGAWLQWLIVTGGAVFASVHEVQGNPMPLTFAFLTVAWPVSTGLLATALGLEKAKQAGWFASHREVE